MSSMFVQIHCLTSYPSVLLNRDDAGLAKRIPFGGVSRTRISSQCLKRHWRTFEGDHSLSSLGVSLSVRSRHSFERFVLAPMIAGGIDKDLARFVTSALMRAALGKSEKAKKAEVKGGSAELQTGQITVLGRAELEYFRELGEHIAKTVGKPDEKGVEVVVKELLGKSGLDNLGALAKSAGLDAALFGRMVTSDILARGDAAVHVAHAFAVHAEASEADFFSAVDDLLNDNEGDELGSGHIGNTELTSGLYYGYVVIDVPLLVSNLEGCPRREWRNADRDLAARIVEDLVHLVAKVSPGAKLGSTAPYSYADLVLAETGSAQPRTLANAFLRPVAERPDLLANTFTALARHVRQLDTMYGVDFTRRVAAAGPIEAHFDALRVPGTLALPALAGWVAAQVKEA